MESALKMQKKGVFLSKTQKTYGSNEPCCAKQFDKAVFSYHVKTLLYR